VAFWSGETLAERLPALIDGFEPEAIDCNAYTLHVGDELYITPERGRTNRPEQVKRQLADGESFTIPPGQFGMLITREAVKVPPNAMAFISIKASVKFWGLINVSGFHVDPGYYGRLVFSVFNASASPVHLERDRPLFLIWYADLDRASEGRYAKADVLAGRPSRTSIDLQLINSNRDSLLSLRSLSERIDAQDEKIKEAERKAEFSRAAMTAAIALLVAVLVALLPVGWDYAGAYLGPAESSPTAAQPQPAPPVPSQPPGT
jgi:dCTP deaminase